MDSEQIIEEIRGLNDHAHRQEAAIDGLLCSLRHIEERAIPASVADTDHRLAGATTLLTSLAGTVHMLAAQYHSLTDRLTLLEQVIDQGPELLEEVPLGTIAGRASSRGVA